MVSWSPRNLLIATILIAAIVGSVTGLAVGYLARPSPSPQTRDIYLFAVDQNFNVTTARGLRSDYIYSSSLLAVNKGDTVKIHFYNPTDKAHSFTMGAPYSNDVVVANMTSTLIQNANITITTSQPGNFAFYCKFHIPMTGTILVQG